MTIDKMALVRRGFALLSRLRSPTLLGGYGESKTRLAHSVVLLKKPYSQTIVKAVWTPGPSDWRTEWVWTAWTLNIKFSLPLVIFLRELNRLILYGDLWLLIKESSALKHKISYRSSSLIISYLPPTCKRKGLGKILVRKCLEHWCAIVGVDERNNATSSLFNVIGLN